MARHRSAQSIFNKVARALLTQGVRSVDETGRCAYRGEGGRRCAVGHLMPDRVYSPNFENVYAGNLTEDVLVAMGCDSHRELLCELQSAHDDSATRTGKLGRSWKAHMRAIAKNHNLSATVLEPKP